MFSLVTLYWSLGLLGALYLLSSLVGGDAFDVDLDSTDLDMDSDLDVDDADDSPKVFSLRLMFGGFLGFAIGGGMSYYNGWSLSTQMIVGSLTAIFFGYLAYLLAKMMYNMQGDSSVSMEDVVGKVGIITVRTANTGKAMIKVPTPNGAQEFLCISKDGRIKLNVGETAKVQSRIGTELMVERIVD